MSDEKECHIDINFKNNVLRVNNETIIQQIVDQYFFDFNISTTLSRSVSRKWFPKRSHLSVIYDEQNKIITYGWSGYKLENIIEGKEDEEDEDTMFSIHSEYKCIENFKTYIQLNHGLDIEEIGVGSPFYKRFKIVNVAYDVRKTIKISKPCLMCASIIERYKNVFCKVFWSTSDKNFESETPEQLKQLTTLSRGQFNLLRRIANSEGR